MPNLRRTLSDLCEEVLARLEEERSRHRRTVDSVRLGWAYMMEDETTTSMSEVLCIDDASKIEKLPVTALELILGQPDFCKHNFRIVILKIVVKDFIPIDEDPEMFREKLKSIVGPFNELPVHCKTEPNSKFTDRRHIGSFRTTPAKNYSSTGVKIPKLVSSSSLEALEGIYLGAGYEEAQPTLISDHTEYNELKHWCFIQWLRQTKYMNKVESEKFKKPDFIAFGGRVADILRSPGSKLYGDWEIYALNYNNVIYLWDEKKSQVAKTSILPSFFGIRFERLVTGRKENSQRVSEYEMMYVVNEVKLDSHQLLVVSKIDAQDEDGKWVEVTVMNDFEDTHYLFQRLLKLWSQCAIPGVEQILLGTKDEGVVQSIEKKSIQDLAAELGDCPDKCPQFLSRFLSFAKSHLPVSDRNQVKKFAFTCGSFNVVCQDVQRQEIQNLLVPRLYDSYLKSLKKKKTEAVKERTNSYAV